VNGWIPIAVLAVAGVTAAIAIKWTLNIRRVIRAVRRGPDHAYDFFLEHPDEWAVFEAMRSAIPQSQLPDATGLPLLGPFQFCVPKLGNRPVTVFGKSKDCFRSLGQLLLRLAVKRQARKTR